MGMGAAALILLPLLISGYLFNLTFYPMRYFAGRAEGQKLFFMAASSGLILTLLVFGGLGLLTDLQGGQENVVSRAGQASARWYSSPYALASALTLVLSWGIGILLNCVLWLVHLTHQRPTKECVYNWLNERYGSSLAQLLRRAAEEQRFVMLSLSSRKIYCGRIIDAPTDTEGDDVYIEIVPIFSSYRGKNTLQMRGRTEYPFIDLWAAKRNLESRIAERDFFQTQIQARGFDASQPQLQQELAKLDSNIQDARQALDRFHEIGDIQAKDWIKLIPIREVESASFYDAKAHQAWFKTPGPRPRPPPPAPAAPTGTT